MGRVVLWETACSFKCYHFKSISFLTGALTLHVVAVLLSLF